MELENVIDDLVLICFCVGNDFLPKMPMLMIAEQGLDHLFTMYAGLIKENNQGWLNNGGRINWNLMLKFLYKVSLYETDVLKKKSVQGNPNFA